MMSTENIGNMPMNSKRRNVHSNKPEAMAVREVSADSVVQVKVSPTVTEVIGIVPMERDFPVAMPVDFQISSNPCSDIGEEEDKDYKEAVRQTLKRWADRDEEKQLGKSICETRPFPTYFYINGPQ